MTFQSLDHSFMNTMRHESNAAYKYLHLCASTSLLTHRVKILQQHALRPLSKGLYPACRMCTAIPSRQRSCNQVTTLKLWFPRLSDIILTQHPPAAASSVLVHRLRARHGGSWMSSPAIGGGGDGCLCPGGCSGGRDGKSDLKVTSVLVKATRILRRRKRFWKSWRHRSLLGQRYEMLFVVQPLLLLPPAPPAPPPPPAPPLPLHIPPALDLPLPLDLHSPLPPVHFLIFILFASSSSFFSDPKFCNRRVFRAYAEVLVREGKRKDFELAEAIARDFMSLAPLEDSLDARCLLAVVLRASAGDKSQLLRLEVENLLMTVLYSNKQHEWALDLFGNIEIEVPAFSPSSRSADMSSRNAHGQLTSRRIGTDSIPVVLRGRSEPTHRTTLHHISRADMLRRSSDASLKSSRTFAFEHRPAARQPQIRDIITALQQTCQSSSRLLSPSPMPSRLASSQRFSHLILRGSSEAA
eukprot:753680-Hanusia_phi.AAC.4